MVRGNFHVRIEGQGTLPGHLRFALADVLLVEQELAVEIADIDRVQVDLKGSCEKSVGEKFSAGELTISICLKPHRTRFLRISQPMPPAPTTSTLLAKIFSLSSVVNTPSTKAIIASFRWK